MNSKPLVSVIIPCFNSELFIQDCVESVLKQTYENIEIILIDDGSTDESLSKIEQFSTKIMILKKENQGAASARIWGSAIQTGVILHSWIQMIFGTQKRLRDRCSV